MPHSKPKLIGITGTIGSGKSLVGQILEELAVPVIDTDKVVHYLLSADTPTRAAVVERFGASVQQPNGAIDRPALGAIVFADEAARKNLEAIVHPAVRAECRARIAAMNDQKMVAVLVPLLFETGMSGEYDEVWTVTANEQTLRERLKQRDKLSDAEADRRLAAQWSQEKKSAQATRVIDNSGTIAETRATLQALIHKLLEPAISE